MAVSSQAADVAQIILDAFVYDNAATPQLTPAGDGGVSVEWRVSGDSLSIDIAGDGQISLFVRDASGHVSLDDENISPEDLGRVAKLAFAQLVKLSQGVKFRASSGVR